MDQLQSLRKRVKKLNDTSVGYQPRSVLYILSRDQRAEANHALLAAQQQAIKEELPLVVLFVGYNHAVGFRSQEQVDFMTAGLAELKPLLATKNISLVLRTGKPPIEWRQAIDDFEPAAIYFDFSPLRGPQAAQHDFAKAADCPVFVVDAHNVVPTWVASDKAEVGARTLRPKIHHHLNEFLLQPVALQKHPHQYQGTLGSLTPKQLADTLHDLYKPSFTQLAFVPGEKAAHKALADFISKRLRGYADLRNDPAADHLSQLSAYLHFGQLASQTVALAVLDAVRADSSLQKDADTLIEEMIVRKELSDNFCLHHPDYDQLLAAPEWAQKTLALHADDPREFVYTYTQFEQAETHDEAWNAAQRQLTRSGKIHGYMRMYWAKKVLEWSKSPQEALDTLIKLNDFYSIDGGDPNGYVGILWSVAGVHDRPWGERAVYGTIRSMVYNGLKRKFDIKAYEAQWPK